jgi:hypothetical protein
MIRRNKADAAWFSQQAFLADLDKVLVKIQSASAKGKKEVTLSRSTPLAIDVVTELRLRCIQVTEKFSWICLCYRVHLKWDTTSAN